MKTRFTDINLLDELQRPEFHQLRLEFTRRSYPRNALVCEPQATRNFVFIVASGRARVYLAYDEKEFTLCMLERGDIYTSHTRAFAQAMEPLELLVMPTERFRELIVRHPAMTRTMVLVLGEMLHSSFSIIHSLVFKEIPRRIAEYLYVAACEHGEKTEEGRLLRLEITTEQLATIVGSTRQSVSETLSRLEREGLVLREGRGLYRIPDLCALEAFAGD